MLEVVFIGTSDAFGAGGRRQTAIAVRTPGGTALLDCGPTTCTGLEQLDIPRDEIDAIVLSHFHGDHFGGIPLFLLGARYEDLREKPLLIAGPSGTAERVRDLARAMSHDFEQPDWTFPIVFEEFEAGVERQIGPLTVRPWEAHHNPDVHPHGLWIEAEGKRLVFSGDTGWFDDLPDLVRGADLFICECTYYDRDYGYHLNLKELTEKKDQLDVRRIILTHLGVEMSDRRGKCEFECADDGMRIKL